MFQAYFGQFRVLVQVVRLPGTPDHVLLGISSCLENPALFGLKDKCVDTETAESTTNISRKKRLNAIVLS